MGLSDIFNIGKIKKENEELKEMLTPEMNDAIDLQHKINDFNKQLSSLESELNKKKQEIEAKSKELDKISKDIITFSDEVLVQEYGLYQPRYNFMSSDVYKERLTTIRNQQKQMIKQDIAASGNTDWTVNNNKAKGRKMVNDMKKLLLRAFNSECDETIGKVKYNNIETSVRKIVKSAEQIQKLGTIMSVYINQSYIDLKIVELYLAFEYQQKKQQEKEEQRELRAQQREEAKLKKEIEEKRKKIKKEQTHYQQALKNLLSQIKEHGETEDLIAKKAELETELSNIDKSIKDIDYREAKQKAGYVYVISNVGSFGENIYKIGMTRRLEPQDRVDKLGDASVPFKFDVHAMIFSDNAPALEAALHRAFEDRKLNMVNTRREFFYVTLDEIKQVVKENFDKTVEFIDFPDAEQYRTSLKMREQLLA